MKMLTVTLEDEQVKWLKEYRGNRSELMRTLLSNFIMEKNKQNLTLAVNELKSEEEQNKEYEGMRSKFIKLPQDLQNEVVIEARQKREFHKAMYLSRAYWTIIFNTAKDMGVID